MLQAYPKPDGTFRLYSDCSSTTYNKRQLIKELGGKWDGVAWIIPESAIAPLNAVKMIRVLLAKYCHEESSPHWVTTEEFTIGETKGWQFCGLCDSRWNYPVKILGVYNG